MLGAAATGAAVNNNSGFGFFTFGSGWLVGTKLPTTTCLEEEVQNISIFYGNAATSFAFSNDVRRKLGTCIGLAAISKPATPPPTTRPSGLAKETLNPPDLLLAPWFSEGVNDPDKESISKRPCQCTIPIN